MSGNLKELAESEPEVHALLITSISGSAIVRQLTQMGFETSESAVKRWRRTYRDTLPTPLAHEDDEAVVPQFTTSDRDQLHIRLDELLDRAQADPSSVSGFKIAAWDTTAKNLATGEVVTKRNYGLRLGVTEKMVPAWPVVQPAAPVVVNFSYRLSPRQTSRDKVALILPDPQIGYRHYMDTGTFDPFHDESAINVAMQIAADLQPDLVVWLGDYLDLAPFSHFEQEPTFASTTQKAIDYGHSLLSQLRVLVPNAKTVVMEGNHDKRLQTMVMRNAMEAFGLKRANELGAWPVLSVPHLLRFDELEVEYVGAYPAGSFWINERLKCIHGQTVRSGGSTALAVANEERVSTIFGHIHRIETQYRTSDVYGGGSIRFAHTPGCMCRIDGAVPSVKGSTDLSGRPVARYENWQQGLSVVSYREGDSPFNLETAFINTTEGYRTSFGGKTYLPSV